MGSGDNLLLGRSLRKRGVGLLLSLAGCSLRLGRLLLQLLNYGITGLTSSLSCWICCCCAPIACCISSRRRKISALDALAAFFFVVFVVAAGTLWGRGRKRAGGESKRQGQSHAFLHFSSKGDQYALFSGDPTGTSPERECRQERTLIHVLLTTDE